MSNEHAWLIEVQFPYREGRGRFERNDRRGYTNLSCDAGRFTEAKAKAAETDLPKMYKAVRLADVERSELTAAATKARNGILDGVIAKLAYLSEADMHQRERSGVMKAINAVQEMKANR